MIRTALYAARTVALIPVISVVFLLVAPCVVLWRAINRRPHQGAELQMRDQAMRERIRLHQLEQDRRTAANGRRPMRRVL
jgi:hypothetical protein